MFAIRGASDGARLRGDGSMDEIREPALFGGVAATGRRPTTDVVAVLRHGVEQAAVRAMGIELTWTTSAITTSDDLQSEAADTGRPGLDWDFIVGREGVLSSVALIGQATALLAHPSHPRATVAMVAAGLRGRDLTVGLSLHRWAMYGGGEDLSRSCGIVSDWLLRSAQVLDASTGYLTLDRVEAGELQSPWERATGRSHALRDVSTDLWGHGWGTLLSPAHLDRVGGVDALVASGLGDVVSLPAGRVWFTLHGGVSDVTRDDVAALRQVLLPALPVGTRSLEEYRRLVEDPELVEPDFLV